MISESISRMIWRLRPLSMAQCVSLIPADACSAIILLEEMPIRAHVPIHADGNMRSWKSPDLGEYLPVYENERGTYIFNSKDLCMIEHIPELIDSRY